MKLLTTFLLLLFPITGHAESFPISVTIPAATQVNFVISKVKPGNPPVFEQHPGLAMDFATAGEGMKFDSQNGIWVGSRFFAIDMATITAAGDPAPANIGNVNFSYTNTAVPPGQLSTKGLNAKLSFTAVKITGAAGSQTETPIITSRNIGGTLPSLTGTQLANGFLRVYVGVATGEIVGGAPVAPGTEPFTNGDKPGQYLGTLTISATLL